MAKKDKKARRKMERAAAHLSPPERLDVTAAGWAAQWRKHPAVKGAGAAAQLADQPQLLALCAGVYGLGATMGDRRLKLCGERMLSAFAAATALKATGKQLFARTRPNAVVKRGAYRRKALGPVEGDWNAFPSGHTAGAVAVAWAVGRTYPRLRAPALEAALFAGGVQVFKGGHFPSDVAAGALVGLVAEAASERALAAAHGDTPAKRSPRSPAAPSPAS